MRALELFCGTKSFGKVAEEEGFEVVSVDIDEQHKPTHCVDILKWNYKEYKRGYFDVIWASPDCTSWSIACHKHRQLPDLTARTDIAVMGEMLIYKTLEIIEYFQPKRWWIENPRCRLRSFIPMTKLPYRTTVYYSNYGYICHKPTDIWSNVYMWKNETKPDRKVKKFGEINNDKRTRKVLRSMIPRELMKKIVGLIEVV